MATQLDIVIEQGATFSKPLTVGVAYNGYSVRATWRKYFGGQILAQFTCPDVSAGATSLGLTAAQTSEIYRPAWAGALDRSIKYGVYDVELISGATVVRSHQGTVYLSAEASA